MGKLIDLSNKRFGLLVVIPNTQQVEKNRKTSWLCQCDCGKEFRTLSDRLRRNVTTSCGCRKGEGSGRPTSSFNIGDKYGKLTIVSTDLEIRRNHTYCFCKCECGNTKWYRFSHLKDGSIKSCICSRYTQNSYTITHQREYNSWSSMIHRCYTPTYSHYESYGGRGIKVCNWWKTSFVNFLNDMGVRPEGTTLDRINVDGNYEPRNCRWADAKTQSQNQRKVRDYKRVSLNEINFLIDTGIIDEDEIYVKLTSEQLQRLQNFRYEVG